MPRIVSGDLLEAVLRRERAVIGVGIGVVVALSWGYILAGAGTGMSVFASSPLPFDATEGNGAMSPVAWTLAYAALMGVMWWVMMVAMMLPAAAPMILLYALLTRRQRERGAAAVPAGVFAAGYLLAWGGFSVLATGLQWGLARSGALSPTMAANGAVLGGFLLVAAGVYQWTPLKHACLKHCRSPVVALSHGFRPGHRGALVMGLEQGLYCLGCCWLLMGLLFFGGVMNLYWIVGLALFVLVEKLAPFGHRTARISGGALAAAGAAVIALA